MTVEQGRWPGHNADGTPHSGTVYVDRSGRPSPAVVLVAEDDPELRKLIVWHLRRCGYEVVSVASGEGLADRLASQLLCDRVVGIDLLVTDLRMPGWSGLEAVSSLRRAGWDLPVVLVTAFADRATQDEAARLGVARVLDKPVEMQTLVDAVRAIREPFERAA